MRSHPANERRAAAGAWFARTRGDRTTGHRAAILMTLLLLAYFTVRGVGRTLRPQGTDLTIYYDAGRAALAGRDPLDVEGFLYLPFYATVMAFPALLPFRAVGVLWTIAGLAALLVGAALCVSLVLPAGRRLRDGPPARVWSWLVWAPVLCIARPIDSNFGNGQVNLFVLLVVLLGAHALAGGRERAAGAWFGLATALKLVPGLFLVYCLARRSWRAAVGGGLVASTLILLGPVPLLGWSGNLRAIDHWRETVGHFAQGGEELFEGFGHLPGQSLAATAYRLLSDAPASSGRREERANVAHLHPDTVAWLVRGILALLLLGLLVPVALRPSARGSPAQARELALVASTALLVAPLVHKAHMVWLLLPFVVALNAAFVERRRGALVALVPAALLISGTAPAVAGRMAATALLTQNVVFWGALVLHLWLLGSVWGAAVRSEDPPAAPRRDDLGRK